MDILGWLGFIFALHIFILMIPWFAYQDNSLNSWQKRLLAWYTLFTPISMFISPVILGLVIVGSILAVAVAFISSVTVVPICWAIEILREDKKKL